MIKNPAAERLGHSLPALRPSGSGSGAQQAAAGGFAAALYSAAGALADARRTAAGSAQVTGPGGQTGNDTDASAAGSHPGHRLFGTATPKPELTLRPALTTQPEKRSSRASRKMS